MRRVGGMRPGDCPGATTCQAAICCFPHARGIAHESRVRHERICGPEQSGRARGRVGQPPGRVGDNRYVSPDAWYLPDSRPFRPQVHYFVGGATKLFGAPARFSVFFGKARHSSLPCASHGTWRISILPIDYLSSFGVTSLSSPVAKSKTNPRIATSDGIHGCDLSFSTCFCVARFTSE